MPQGIEQIANANLGWQYYKNYYQHSQLSGSIEDKNCTILKRQFVDVDKFFKIDCHHSFELRVNYPGLLTGSGYTHEYTGDDKDGAFKIGFFFDHITGMPYITGHGIKGVIRGAFPNHNKDRYKKQKANFIIDLLRKRDINAENVFNKYLVQQGINNLEFSELNFALLLGEIIFEGNQPKSFRKDEFVYSQLPLGKKDIFYDCYISAPGENNLFLADDYITPHIPNPLKNPVPIKFLKIRPGVSFMFQFELKDNLISAEQKKVLFEDIILTFGVGAKTNVGYGQFSPIKKVSDTEPGTTILDKITKSSDPVAKMITTGSEWSGLISAEKGDNLVIEFYVNEQVVRLKKKKDKFKGNEPGIGKKVSLKFNAVFNNESPNFSATVID